MDNPKCKYWCFDFLVQLAVKPTKVLCLEKKHNGEILIINLAPKYKVKERQIPRKKMRGKL